MKIYIDAGHGGKDPGAVGNGLLEKNLTLQISLIEKQLFVSKGHQVRMSRTGDATLSLSARVNDANTWGADVFISNHINAGGGTGEEVWCSIYGGLGRTYATRVEKNLSEIFKSRGVKTKRGSNGDYFYVIRATRMPAILPEFAFIDSESDTDKLKSQDIINKCAAAVVDGILGETSSSSSIVTSAAPVEKIVTTPFKRYLRYTKPYMVGSDVKQVQAKLVSLGINPGPVDGYFGYKTRSGVLAYQRKKNLAVDGIVGPQTWNSLFN
ncbi:N-acetylmuramoyl-L-alanine amidase [Clostridium sp. DL1XJH146]